MSRVTRILQFYSPEHSSRVVLTRGGEASSLGTHTASDRRYLSSAPLLPECNRPASSAVNIHAASGMEPTIEKPMYSNTSLRPFFLSGRGHPLLWWKYIWFTLLFGDHLLLTVQLFESTFLSIVYEYIGSHLKRADFFASKSLAEVCFKKGILSFKALSPTSFLGYDHNRGKT